MSCIHDSLGESVVTVFLLAANAELSYSLLIFLLFHVDKKLKFWRDVSLGTFAVTIAVECLSFIILKLACCGVTFSCL